MSFLHRCGCYMIYATIQCTLPIDQQSCILWSILPYWHFFLTYRKARMLDLVKKLDLSTHDVNSVNVKFFQFFSITDRMFNHHTVDFKIIPGSGNCQDNPRVLYVNSQIIKCSYVPACARLSMHNGFTGTLSFAQGGRINIKMPSNQYRKSHCGDKIILRPFNIHNGISCTVKTTSSYWTKALATSQ